jgi:hypothetical protein
MRCNPDGRIEAANGPCDIEGVAIVGQDENAHSESVEIRLPSADPSHLAQQAARIPSRLAVNQ